MTVRILEGDCRDVLRTLADASVDSVVTDPPYELGFMGKAWDSTGIAYDVAMWREVLRVLKPGGHMLAFGGSRTYHRMACAIEDAGFQIRDQIMWLYGSGFPKSLDVSKAIDKAAGAERAIVGSKFGLPGYREGPHGANAVYASGIANGSASCAITAPATEAAKQWTGWGTALKPAHEPIGVARKPLIGTVAANMLRFGTGALNIDGCRVPGAKPDTVRGAGGANGCYSRIAAQGAIIDDGRGRWPANVCHDGSEEVLACFPDAPGQQGDLNGQSKGRKSRGIFGDMPAAREFKARLDGEASAEQRYALGGATNFAATPGQRRPQTSASRFFYCAKASKSDREAGCDGLPTKQGGMVSNTSGQHITRRDGGEPGARANHHPTVKPTDLMRWLVRLVTPPGGTVLDPFAGSGSTGRAANIEGFDAILIELNPEYAAIARARINGDSPLFGAVA